MEFHFSEEEKKEALRQQKLTEWAAAESQRLAAEETRRQHEAAEAIRKKEEDTKRRADPRWKELEGILRTDKLFKPLEYEFVFESYSSHFLFKLNLPDKKLGVNATEYFRYPKIESDKQKLKEDFEEYLEKINLRNGTRGGWGLFGGWF